MLFVHLDLALVPVEPMFTPRGNAWLFEQALAFKHLSDFFKAGRDLARWKPDLTEALDVAKLLAALLEQHDRFREA